jgi:hypothetical protein
MPKKIKKTTKSSKRAKKDLQQKMNMFDRLPDECSACLKSFDKKDKEMVKSWHVVVKNDENVVRLYCTSCWKAATSVVEDFESSIK